jgi:5-oxoprolinase (ATP-hydrolysing) subunit A
MTSGKSKNQKVADSSKALFFGEGLGEVFIDINCDMGEGMDNDELIMPYISSTNIACGYHAGDEQTIWKTIELAIQYNVAIGAHVSFFDKENFGRSEMDLPAAEVYDLVTQQLIIIKEIADSFDIKIRHVKPHGALYNMSAKDAVFTKTIAQAVKDFDHSLVLFGLSGSHSIAEAKAIGLKTASEVFADRTYQNDGSLTPRSQTNALIEDSDKAIEQVLQMIKKGTVTSVSGKQISIEAETICIHGDGKHAVLFAKNIYENLKQNNIDIKAI